GHVAGYPPAALVTDAASAFVEGHRDYFARVPLAALPHPRSRRLDFDIRKAKRAPDAPSAKTVCGRCISPARSSSPGSSRPASTG
ncbi:MAG: hypothetical protein ACYCO3_17015, partial [Mycobacteriales bacterium]